MSRSSEEELDAAYKLGLEQGRMEAKFGPLLEDLPAFEPWTSGAHFERKRSWFDSLVAYERSVTGSLREAEKVRWALERTLARLELEIEAAAEDSMPLSAWTHRLFLSRLLRIASGRAPALDPHTELKDCEDEISLVDRIQAVISNQLYLVRQAVDAELEYGRGYAWTIEAMRSPPQRPRGVRELAGVQVFVAGDQRRGCLAADGHFGCGRRGLRLQVATRASTPSLAHDALACLVALHNRQSRRSTDLRGVCHRVPTRAVGGDRPGMAAGRDPQPSDDRGDPA